MSDVRDDLAAAIEETTPAAEPVADPEPDQLPPPPPVSAVKAEHVEYAAEVLCALRPERWEPVGRSGIRLKAGGVAPPQQPPAVAK